jgi:G3E family GTPase
VLQAVHELIDLRPDHAWQNEARQSKVVFIGRNLDRAALDRSLRGCLSEAAA